MPETGDNGPALTIRLLFCRWMHFQTPMHASVDPERLRYGKRLVRLVRAMWCRPAGREDLAAHTLDGKIMQCNVEEGCRQEKAGSTCKISSFITRFMSHKYRPVRMQPELSCFLFLQSERAPFFSSSNSKHVSMGCLALLQILPYNACRSTLYPASSAAWFSRWTGSCLPVCFAVQCFFASLQALSSSFATTRTPQLGSHDHHYHQLAC